MFDIQINNQSLIIDDISIDYDVNNPATSSDQGSLVYSFDVPDDDEKVNASVINHINRVNAVDKFQDMNGKVIVDGKTFIEGAVKYLGQENNRLNFEMYFDTGEIYSVGKSRYIDSLMIIDDAYADEEAMLSAFEAEKAKSWPDAKFTFFPVDADNYLPEETQAKIRYENATAVPAEDDEVTQDSSKGTVLFVDDNGDGTGYIDIDHVEGTFTPGSSFTFQDSETADIITDGFQDYFQWPSIINKWDSGNNQFYRTDAGNNSAIIVPFIYLPEVIYKMINDLGYQVLDEFFTRYPAFGQIAIFNLYNVNGDVPGMPFYSYKVYTKNHLPHYSYNEFIEALDLYGIKLIPNSSTREIKIIHIADILNDIKTNDLPDGIIEKVSNYQYTGFSREIEGDTNDELFENVIKNDELQVEGLNDPVDTYNDFLKTQGFGIWYVKEEQSFYRRQFSFAVDFEIVKLGNSIDNLKTKYFSLDASEDIKGKISPLYFDFATRVGYKSEDHKELTLRIAFSNGQPTSGNYSLYFDGTNGMINRFFKYETAWRIRRRSITLLMPTTKEHMLRRIHEKYQSNELQYLIHQVRGQLEKNGKNKIEIEAYTL